MDRERLWILQQLFLKTGRGGAVSLGMEATLSDQPWQGSATYGSDAFHKKFRNAQEENRLEGEKIQAHSSMRNAEMKWHFFRVLKPNRSPAPTILSRSKWQQNLSKWSGRTPCKQFRERVNIPPPSPFSLALNSYSRRLHTVWMLFHSILITTLSSRCCSYRHYSTGETTEAQTGRVTQSQKKQSWS